jgi:hypothetical protein
VGLVAALAQKEKKKPSGRDNTLSILQKRKAENVELQNKKIHETKEKDVIPSQIESNNLAVISDKPLPLNWKAVNDSISGKIYYWNNVTNETSWELPDNNNSVVDTATSVTAATTLPSGWKEVLHPATKQKYYVHDASGKKSWTFPTTTADGAAK